MKEKVIRLIVAGVLFGGALAVPYLGQRPWAEWVSLGLFLASYLLIGLEVVIEAAKNIVHGRVFDEHFLMAVATIGAFAIGEYAEAVAVMLFYQIGEAFQDHAVDRSRESITELMDLRPDSAAVLRNGELQQTDPAQVAVGETIVVKPGEKIPLDGTVIRGSATLETSALTGESLPRDAGEGDPVISGCIDLDGVLEIRVEKEFAQSTVSKILELVENAGNKKSNSEQFITRFAAVYTPVVVAAAVLLAVLPPLLVPGQPWPVWIKRALSFLVISCPCALVISIPLSFFGGIGGASRAGILIKGSNYLEALNKTDTVVFDKTGTLTKGKFEVQEIRAEGMEPGELLELAAHAESITRHPISLSIQQAYQKSGGELDLSQVGEGKENSGHGVSATVKGKKILAGNRRFLEQNGIQTPELAPAGTVVYVACDGEYAGCLSIADSVKEDAKEAIRGLKEAGIRTVMLTGDSQEAGESAAAALGIDEAYCQLLPDGKVERLEAILEQEPAGKKAAFVGDGINDAPVLARADIGIAMGGLGSDAAIEAADIVIMTDEPSRLLTARNISAKTLAIARENTVFAIGVKLLVLVLAALGISTMWEAVFADVGVAVIAVLNSMRALRVPGSRKGGK